MGAFKAVIFDLDGTLVESAPDLAAAANKLLGELGREPLNLPTVRPLIGDGVRKLVERALAATGGLPPGGDLDRLTERFLALYEPILAERTRAFPGVDAALARLAASGLVLAVCTNKPERLSRALLRALALDARFAVIAGGDTTAAKKPDPRHLLFVLDRLGIRPAEALMVGDNEHDAAAAHGAGMPVILVRFGYSRIPVGELGADALLNSFEALPDLVAKLGPRATPDRPAPATHR